MSLCKHENEAMDQILCSVVNYVKISVVIDKRREKRIDRNYLRFNK
jgi:hypothetical protein